MTITPDPSYMTGPRVYGDWVVWEELVGSYLQIRAYQISTGVIQPLTTDNSNHHRPDISGNLVVYGSDQNGNMDIYSYDLASGLNSNHL
jgi:beta propeller repeat protein